jgi:predicted site-specific integrase-resolvase
MNQQYSVAELFSGSVQKSLLYNRLINKIRFKGGCNAKNYGYARVSTREQNEDRQVAALLAQGVAGREVCADRSKNGR